MDIIRINNQQQWEETMSHQNSTSPFVQSWFWGNILEAEGQRIERLAIMEENNVIGLAQVVFYNLPLNIKYAFCPQGPIFHGSTSKKEIINTLVDYLHKRGCVFFRIEPADIDGIQAIPSIDINPSSTVLLDITRPEEEILKQMKSKTRYNIRLAQKKDLDVKIEKNLDDFYLVSQKTAHHDGFKLHSKEHYKNILNSVASYQLSVQKDNQVIASNVFIGYNETFTYLFGASDHEYRSLMSPYLLQWQGILLAKQLGYKKYDFFGIAPTKVNGQGKISYSQKHQYAGVTRFKLGFGGEIVQRDGTFDIIISRNKYYLYKLLRKLRRLF